MYRLWDDLSVQEIVLGTAQWGFGYGVTNTQSRLGDAALEQIVTRFKAHGLSRVDTAQGYGDAQQRLRPWARELLVTTKVKGRGLENSWESVVSQCLEELGKDQLEACLVHDWYELDDEEKNSAARGLEKARSAGLVQRVGVSVYENSELVSAAHFIPKLDMVQIPVNLLDRRFEESSIRAQLSTSGTVFQARSVFLQGLLCAPTSLPIGMHPSLEEFFQYCRNAERNPIEVALSYVQSLSWIDQIVVGVTSAKELQEVVDSWNSAKLDRGFPQLKTSDATLIDPRNWILNHTSEAE